MNFKQVAFVAVVMVSAWIQAAWAGESRVGEKKEKASCAAVSAEMADKNFSKSATGKSGQAVKAGVAIGAGEPEKAQKK